MSKEKITGMVLKGETLEWTSLTAAKSGIQLSPTQRATLELPEETEGLSEAVAPQIATACKGLKGPVSFALPTEKVLLRVVDLPSADPDELAGMAELQVDKFSPFPVDRMAVSFEILMQKDESTQVLIAAVSREHVERVGEVLSSAGLYARHVDIELLGYWSMLKEHADLPEHGFQMILVAEKGTTDLIAIQSGVPVIFRSLGAHGSEDEMDYAEEVAQEAGFTLTSLEAEWGISNPTHVYLWHRGEPPAFMVEQVQEVCEVVVETRPLDDLPPLSEGLARRVFDRETSSVDLAPVSWFEAMEHKKFRRRVLVASIILLALWSAAVSAFTVMYQSQQSGLDELETLAAAREGPAEEVRAYQDKVKSLQQYADRTYSVLECLREVSVLLPEGVDLTSCSYRKADAVNLRGVSADANKIYTFSTALENSELFEELNGPDVSTVMDRGQQRNKFQLKLILPGDST